MGSYGAPGSLRRRHIQGDGHRPRRHRQHTPVSRGREVAGNYMVSASSPRHLEEIVARGALGCSGTAARERSAGRRRARAVTGTRGRSGVLVLVAGSRSVAHTITRAQSGDHRVTGGMVTSSRESSSTLCRLAITMGLLLIHTFDAFSLPQSQAICAVPDALRASLVTHHRRLGMSDASCTVAFRVASLTAASA